MATQSPLSTSSTYQTTPLRILLLHGYTQSGPLFTAKSRALHKAFQKSFSPRPVHFSYPTGPLRLQPSDVPGHEPYASLGNSEEEDIEAYGWWRRKDTDEGVVIYGGIEEGLATIAKCVREEGPFDGVIGFSQGAAAAVMVASLLEGEKRVQAFEDAEKNGGMPYPASFRNGKDFVQQSMKFAVSYSGFCAPGEKYRGFYEPKIETPTMHFLGQMDTVVEEGRCRALVEATQKGEVVVHPGGHFLPSGRPWLDAVVGFVKRCVEGKKEVEEKEEERVEDMDVPF